MTTADDIYSDAQAAGLDVVSVEMVPIDSAGNYEIAARLAFDDPWAAARFLDLRSTRDASDPYVRAYALDLQRACAEELGEDDTGPTRSPELRDCLARAIHLNVQRHIKFIHERKETFQSARTTLRKRAGDCDDHAALVKALALAVNLPAELVFFDDGEQPVHVTGTIEDSRGPQWAETTIPALFGEDPYAALERVEVETGENPMAHAPSMGVLGLDFVTPKNVHDRKVQLDQVVHAIDSDLSRCTTLDAATHAAWNDFATGWETFMANEPGWFDSGAQGRQAADYAEQIRAWQTKLGACASSAPMVNAPPDDPIVGVAKALAIGTVAVAAAVGVGEVTGVLRVFGRRKNGRRRRR